jgi:hypothetical protein
MGGMDRGEPEAALRAELEAMDRVRAAWAAWSQDPSPKALAELGAAVKALRSTRGQGACGRASVRARHLEESSRGLRIRVRRFDSSSDHREIPCK